jgi:transcriptional regulator with XRE-family HTH domain
MGIKGSDIVKRIDSALRERGQTRKALVEAGALKSAKVVTAWLARDNIPRADAALAIADCLGVSVRWLLTGEAGRGLTPEEGALLAKYRGLDNRGRYEVNALLDAKLEGGDS